MVDTGVVGIDSPVCVGDDALSLLAVLAMFIGGHDCPPTCSPGFICCKTDCACGAGGYICVVLPKNDVCFVNGNVL